MELRRDGPWTNDIDLQTIHAELSSVYLSNLFKNRLISVALSMQHICTDIGYSLASWTGSNGSHATPDTSCLTAGVTSNLLVYFYFSLIGFNFQGVLCTVCSSSLSLALKSFLCPLFRLTVMSFVGHSLLINNSCWDSAVHTEVDAIYDAVCGPNNAFHAHLYWHASSPGSFIL